MDLDASVLSRFVRGCCTEVKLDGVKERVAKSLGLRQTDECGAERT